MAQGDSPLEKLARFGVSVESDGSISIPKEALERIRDERLRRATMSKVPSTPRYMFRDGGGLGVRKGGSRYEVLSLESLRKIRERSPILHAIHQARHFQVRRMSRRWNGIRGEVGWRVVHKDHHEHTAEQPDYIKPYIDRFESILAQPAPKYGCRTTGDLLGPLWEDLATINRPSVEILRSAWDHNRIVGFRPIDGGILWPTLIWLEKWLSDNPRFYERNGFVRDQLNPAQALQLVSEIVGHDIQGADYVLVRDGSLEAVYTDKDILIAPLSNRTDISFAGYPPSHVENAIEAILAFLNTWEYNTTFFTRGMMAEFILGISGDVHDDDIDAFVDMLREATQGIQRAWQPPVMPLPNDGVLTKIDLKQNNKEMQYEVWMSLLVALATAVYRMDPSTINARPWDGGGGSQLGAPNREKEIALAKEEGLQGDLGHLVDSLLTPLARTCHPDLIVVMEYGDFDPQVHATIAEAQARVSRTRNEVRLEAGDKPLGFWVPIDELDELSDEDREKYESNPWNMPTDATFAQYKQQEAMQKQMEAQEQMGMEGQEPDGFGGEQLEDDGFGGQQAPEQPPEPDGFGGEQVEGGGGDEGYGSLPTDLRQQEQTQAPMQKGRKVTIYVEEIA